jgi:Vam6/Vps39-like protein vacuolar protein sorting-associated protein 39
MAFLDHSTISVAYSPTEYAVFSIERLTATDVALPSLATTSMAGMGAFAGLTGYMTLGLGTKPRSGVLRMSDTEALVAKDSESMNRVILVLCLKHEVCRSSVYNWGRRQTDKIRSL